MLLRRFIFLFILFSQLIASTAFGQLSGNYTIGGLSPDFPTIDSATQALSAYGISDTVTFYVRSGTYSGIKYFDISYSYPVSIIGETRKAKDVIIECARISCDNFKIQHITIKPRVPTYFLAPFKGMEVQGTELQIDSCIILGPTLNFNYNNGLWVWSPGWKSPAKGVSLTNLEIRKLDIGVVISNIDYYGTDRLNGTYEISNCVFDSCRTGIYHIGNIRDSLSISGNTITNSNYGIHLQGKDVRRTYITSNNIVNATLYGIYFQDVNAWPKRFEIMNNFISGGRLIWEWKGSDKIYKNVSVLLNKAKSVDFVNNSINGGLQIISCEDLKIYNNNFSTERSIPFSIDASTAKIDYNNYYSEVGDYILSFKGTIFKNLNFMAGPNSISEKPFFKSSVDLHSHSPYLQFEGNRSKGPEFDIDGEKRTLKPDIGADEYNSSDLPPFAWYEYFCKDDTMGRSFNNMSVRGKSYKWDFGDGNTSSNINPNHIYSTTGNFTCSLIASNNFGTSVFTDSIEILPSSLEKIIAKGNKLSISAGYSSYNWYLDGVELNGMTGNSITALKPGEYEVRYRDNEGCRRFSSLKMWIGINEIHDGNKIQIYPNPVRDVLFIKSLSNMDFTDLKMIDFRGQIVYYTQDRRSEIQIPVNQLNSGLYFIELKSNRDVFHFKVLIR